MFEQNQLSFERVRGAYENTEDALLDDCWQHGISPDDFGDVLIRVFKAEKVMELWVKRVDGSFAKLREYPICQASGKLGPKKQQGDYQVPEGFYEINVFNPLSNYHLSLGVSYPNEADRIRVQNVENRGGDIYVHGSCASIGCMAMTDPLIEEIYVCAVKARSQGQEKIPIEIFPFRMSFKNLDYYTKQSMHSQHAKFWRNLQVGYWFFEKNNRPPVVSVDSEGLYHFE